MKASIHTVAGLRKALEGLPDDMVIYCQAVAEDGSCWNMYGTLGDVIAADPPAKVLTLRHPNLRTLKGLERDVHQTF